MDDGRPPLSGGGSAVVAGSLLSGGGGATVAEIAKAMSSKMASQAYANERLVTSLSSPRGDVGTVGNLGR